MIPLLHPGYHKTATTWLQRRLFLPEHGFASLFPHAEVHRRIFAPGPFAFDAAALRAAAEARHAELGAHLVPVISSEILAGQPFLGGRECRLLADRLAAAFPEARVLLTIREQLALLPSLYMQYLLAGGTVPPARFFDPPERVGSYAFDPAYYEFHHLVEHYAGLFGAANVLVSPMERLGPAPAATIGRIARFAGAATEAQRVSRAPLSRAAKESAAPLLRRLNHFRRGSVEGAPMVALDRPAWLLYRAVGRASRSALAAASLARDYRPVSRLVRRRFAGRYAASNRRLAGATGLDLAALGYAVAADAPPADAASADAAPAAEGGQGRPGERSRPA